MNRGAENASRQAWEGGRAQGAAASSSSSLKQQLRSPSSGVSTAMPQDMADGGKQGLTCKNGPPNSVCDLCVALGMERGGTTGLWLQ